jgi:hypothetical protein
MSLDATTWAWKKRLKSTEKLVLLSMADRAGEDHKCYPSIARLAYDTGLNRKTVTSVLKRLRDAGIIGKTGRMVGPNMSVPEYQLNGVQGREDDAEFTVPKNGHSPKAGTAQNRDECHTQNWVDPKTDTTQKRVGYHAQKRVGCHAQKRVTESPIESPIESPSIYCAEVEATSPPPAEKRCAIFCTLQLNDGTEFAVSEDFVSELTPLYPNVDVMQALRAMKGWLIGNAKKRKTRRGIKAFITSWLSREQDKPRAAVVSSQQGQIPQPRSYRECVDLEQRQEVEFLNQLREELHAARSTGADSLGTGQAQSALASGESIPRD